LTLTHSSDGRSVSGRAALITGAGSGIGRATALLLAAEGARVAAADCNLEAVESVAAEITAAGGEALACQLDVCDDSQVRSVVAQTVEAYGALDILVNCAGIALPAAFGDEEAWERTLDVNLKGSMRTIRAALPQLRASDAGRVVNIASTDAQVATPMMSAYTVSKHGVVGLTRALAVELADSGVTVNAVMPGPINTGMTAAIGEDDRRRFARRRVALRRYGEPGEVAQAILNLVLPASSYTQGACLRVDGGMLTVA